MRPVVVEVRPDNVPSTMAPSSPSALPKSVRFAPTSSNRSSRPLTSVEAWSLYNFEIHARTCDYCFNSLAVHEQGGRLCDIGLGLAEDVACHVYHHENEIYSTRKDDSKLVRVEVPRGYTHLRQLLSKMGRTLRSHKMMASIPSYDRYYPVPARRSSLSAHALNGTVTIEPASSSDRSKRPSSIKAHYGYTTIESQPARSVPAVSKERRGTLYEKDLQRKQDLYNVEIREPDRRERRRYREEGKRNSVWL